MIRYTKNWLNHNAFNALNKFKGLDNLNFLEIGSFEGQSANFFIDNYLTGSNCYITCIDPWIEYSQSTVGNIQGWDEYINPSTYNLFISNTQHNKDKIIVYKHLSQEILHKLDPVYDFIYIDGDHTTSAVMYDAVNGFKLLKNKGILIFDDYDWVQGSNRPKIAIDSFLEEYKNELNVIEIGSQITIEKK
jgi:hypothetical protein